MSVFKGKKWASLIDFVIDDLAFSLKTHLKGPFVC